MCACNWCKLYHRVRRTVLNGSRNQLRHLVAELFEKLGDQGTDLNYHKAILNGSWPGSVEILTRALERAKERMNAKASGSVA